MITTEIRKTPADGPRSGPLNQWAESLLASAPRTVGWLDRGQQKLSNPLSIADILVKQKHNHIAMVLPAKNGGTVVLFNEV